jgi:hypothetical protein
MWILRSNAGKDIPVVRRSTQNQASNLRRWLMADNSYEVGFGRPPKHTQFRKGHSGNPKGRPKESKNISALTRKMFQEKVAVKSNGRTQTMTKLEAAFAQLINKAANGDLKAFKEVIRLSEKLQEQEPFPNVPTITVNFVKPPKVDSGSLERGGQVTLAGQNDATEGDDNSGSC